MRALFDTSVLADYLRGLEPARRELDAHQDRLVSILTWTELMAEARSEDEARSLEAFLGEFSLVELTRPIARRAAALRVAHGLRLPDALVLASAHEASAVLVTRSTDAYPAGSPGIRMPY